MEVPRRVTCPALEHVSTSSVTGAKSSNASGMMMGIFTDYPHSLWAKESSTEAGHLVPLHSGFDRLNPGSK